MTRRPIFSGGLSWAAIAIIVTVVLAVGVPVVGCTISINRELGKISTTLERVATDLVDNKSDHKEFRQAIVDLTASHDRRLSVLEAE